MKSGFKQYVFLSKAIYEYLQRNDYDDDGYIGGINWLSSDGGFDGFGGGDFGGGGAVGDW